MKNIKRATAVLVLRLIRYGVFSLHKYISLCCAEAPSIIGLPNQCADAINHHDDNLTKARIPKVDQIR